MSASSAILNRKPIWPPDYTTPKEEEDGELEAFLVELNELTTELGNLRERRQEQTSDNIDDVGQIFEVVFHGIEAYYKHEPHSGESVKAFSANTREEAIEEAYDELVDIIKENLDIDYKSVDVYDENGYEVLK